jgi:transposase-like protein
MLQDGTYSDEFKDRMINLMLADGGPSANQLSDKTGVSQPTLSRWLRAAKKEAAGEDDETGTEMGDFIPIILLPRKDLENSKAITAKIKAAIGA